MPAYIVSVPSVSIQAVSVATRHADGSLGPVIQAVEVPLRVGVQEWISAATSHTVKKHNNI